MRMKGKALNGKLLGFYQLIQNHLKMISLDFSETTARFTLEMEEDEFIIGQWQ